MKKAEFWIRELGLEPHPEGGYFTETYRSAKRIGECCVGDGFEGSRSVATAIYYLLEGRAHSALHRLRADETWHHYHGSSLTLHLITATGRHRTLVLGTDLAAAERPQITVEAGCWLAATVNHADSFALVGCTVSPGFDFRDFEMADRQELVRLHPDLGEIIEKLTHRTG